MVLQAITEINSYSSTSDIHVFVCLCLCVHSHKFHCFRHQNALKVGYWGSGGGAIYFKYQGPLECYFEINPSHLEGKGAPRLSQNSPILITLFLKLFFGIKMRICHIERYWSSICETFGSSYMTKLDSYLGNTVHFLIFATLDTARSFALSTPA